VRVFFTSLFFLGYLSLQRICMVLRTRMYLEMRQITCHVLFSIAVCMLAASY